MTNQHTLDAIDQALKDIEGPYESWLDEDGKARAYCFRSGYACGVVNMAWQLGQITLEQFDEYHEIIRLTERK